MKRSRNLVKYQRNLPTKASTKVSSFTWLIGIGFLVGLIIWLVFRGRKTTTATRYLNTETWDIDWTEDGLPKKVTIHRQAQRG